MTAAEFRYLVAKMRAAQSNYFRNRTPENLRQAKAVEVEVDRELARPAEDLFPEK